MAAKKSKPRAVPRLHELKVDEIVEKGHQAVHASRKLVQESRIMTEASREIIKELSQAEEEVAAARYTYPELTALAAIST